MGWRLGRGRLFDGARLSSLLGCTCGSMILVLFIFLFMIFEGASVEVAWSFCVSITLELRGLNESDGGKEG